MLRKRLFVYSLILVTVVFLPFYVLLGILTKSRDVAIKAQSRITEYSQMVEADHDTLLSMFDNLKILHQRIKTVDTEQNNSQLQLSNTLNSKLEIHQALLDSFQKQNFKKSTSVKQHERVAQEKAHSFGSRTGKRTVPLCTSSEGSSPGNIVDVLPESNNILSYSLFGYRAEALSSFIYNVYNESKSVFPYKQFSIRIYHDKSISTETRLRITGHCPGVRFCDVTRVPGYGDLSKNIGTVWRFIPMADATVDVFCSRDLDSPLITRGGNAVQEWLSSFSLQTFPLVFKKRNSGSNTLLHIMRDSKMHMLPMMGGTWCFRPSASGDVGAKLLDEILLKSDTIKNPDLTTRADQQILAATVWRLLRSQSLQHDAFHCGVYRDAKAFPTERRFEDQRFVGCVRDCRGPMVDICPIRCRPKNHTNWIYC